jgi:hypothetical protein
VTIIREDLFDVAARLDGVREAAVVLGVHPRELAERVMQDIDKARIREEIKREAGDGPPTARHDMEAAYRVSRAIKQRATALAYGFASWH